MADYVYVTNTTFVDVIDNHNDYAPYIPDRGMHFFQRKKDAFVFVERVIKKYLPGATWRVEALSVGWNVRTPDHWDFITDVPHRGVAVNELNPLMYSGVVDRFKMGIVR